MEAARINEYVACITATAGLHARGNAGKELRGVSRSIDVQWARDIDQDVAAIAGPEGRASDLASIADRQSSCADRHVTGVTGAAVTPVRNPLAEV